MQTISNVVKPEVIYQKNKNKFSEEITKKLEEFATKNAKTERKKYKQEWEKFIEENNYKKSCNPEMLDNMFKSARYYYRKKYIAKKQEEQEEQEQQEQEQPNKKKYPTMSRQMRKKMETHIQEQIIANSNYFKDENIIKTEMMPQNAYNDFCSSYASDIYNEIMKWTNECMNPSEISLKFKKSYKNMFYKKIKQLTK